MHVEFEVEMGGKYEEKYQEDSGGIG